MVDYGALAGRDQALALDLLEEQINLVRDILPMFQGREIKSSGDRMFMQFASALAAVQCAVEIQRTLAERNEKKGEDRQIRIRIGVSLEDVDRRGDKGLGNGVDIVAHIQRLAEPGGICVTRGVFERIYGKLPETCIPLENEESRNLPAGVGVYKVVLDAAPSVGGTALASRRLLFWLVLGLVVLNILLFVKFGLDEKPARSNSVPASNSVAPASSLQKR